MSTVVMGGKDEVRLSTRAAARFPQSAWLGNP
jgi:hypothetical protein